MIAARRGRWLHAALIAVATVALCWPAIWNGYPLIFPDSYAYVVEGRTALHAMVGHANPGFLAMRPELYTASLYLLHWRRSPWPVILLQAALTAWILWLVVRAVVPQRTAGWYLGIVLVLCGLTSLAWTASWILPDMLGPIAYLAMALLLFEDDALGRTERWGVMAAGCWCLCAHPSHLIVAALLYAALLLLWLLRWPALRGAGGGMAAVAGIMVAATVLPMGAHLLMYGHASVNESRPPYLLARLTAETSGQAYLRAHCDTAQWTVCRYRDRMTSDSDEFLYAENGVWQAASAADRAAMFREEKPLLLAVLRSAPLAQMRSSSNQAAHQFLEFHEFALVADAGYPTAIERLFPGQGAIYARSLQGRNHSLPWAFQRLLYDAVAVSAAATLVMLPWVWGRQRMVVLVTLVILAMVFNAAVTGVLSEVSWRYQSRVAWMAVLLPLLMAAQLLNARTVIRR